MSGGGAGRSYGTLPDPGPFADRPRASLLSLPSPMAGDLFNIFIVLAVVALAASLLGFRGVAGMSADFARLALVAAVILFILAFVL